MIITAYGFIPVGEWKLCTNVKSGIRFALTHYQKERVVYAFVTDGRPVYIGICDKNATTLTARMNRYQSRCGNGTNESNAARIRQCLLSGKSVQIYALKPIASCAFVDLQVDMVKGLENPLIVKLKPVWNGKTLKPDAYCEELDACSD